MAPKLDNSDLRSKVIIRQEALKLIGGPAQPKVLDCYAGKGMMRKMAWAEVAAYLGCDKHYSRADCLRGDNRRLIDQMITMDAWNVFDLDAYANPWPLANQIAHLMPEGRKVMVLTCSQERAFELTKGGAYLRASSGYPARWDSRLLFRFYFDLIRWQLASWPTVIKTVKVKRKDTQSKKTFYWLVEMVKNHAQE